MYLVYYVYAYLRKSDNTPYYIGKGKDDRAFRPHSKNGKGIHTPTDKSRIVFLETNLSDVGSLAIERRMIEWYGRKDIGTGILRNRTDGGDGASGAIRSDIHKFQISAALKGRVSPTKGTISPMKGKTISAEQKSKISVGLTGNIISSDTRNKISAALKGRPKSAETKMKISETLKARNTK